MRTEIPGFPSKIINTFIDGSGILWQIKPDGIIKYELEIDTVGNELDVNLLHSSADGLEGVVSAFKHNNKIYTVDQNFNFVEIDVKSGKAELIVCIQKLLETKGEISSVIKYHDDYVLSFKTQGVVQLSVRDKKVEIQELDVYSGVFSMIKNQSQDNFWIASDGEGVFMCSNDEYHFNTYTFDDFHIPIYKPIRALFVDDSKNLWIGTKGDGIFKIENFNHLSSFDKCHFKNYTSSNSQLPNDCVYSITEGVKGMLWFGQESGVSFYSYTGVIQNLKFDDLTEPINYVFDIFEQNDSTLWLATAGGGIIRLTLSYEYNVPEVTRIKRFNIDEGKVSSNYFFSLSEKNDSIILFGNRGKGAFLINTFDDILVPLKTDIEPKYSDALKDVYSVNCDDDGVYWLGTSYGLIKVDSSSSYIYDNSYGFSSNTIHTIISDFDDNIWLSSNNGIIRFDPKLKVTQSYNQNNMSDVIEFSDGACYYNPSSDNILFGGVNGFVSITSNRGYESINYEPDITLSGFKVNGVVQDVFTFKKAYAEDNCLNLIYTQNFFSFDFSVVDFLRDDKYLFFYKLEGANDDWINNGNSNSISFSHLPPGDYVLNVCYKNLISDSFGKSLLININIIPPWYKSHLAYLLYFLLFICLNILVIAYFRKIYSFRSKLMEKSLNEQKREEVYEAKNQMFSEIIHDFFTPLTLILGPCEEILNSKCTVDIVNENVGLIKRNAGKLHNLVQEIVDTRKLELKRQHYKIVSVNLNSAISDIAHSFLPSAKTNNVHFNIDLPDSIVWPTNLSYFDRILTNLMSNAFKYVDEQGTVFVGMIKKEDFVQIKISNTGDGIPFEKLANIFEISEDVIKKSKGKGRGHSHGMGLSVCKHLISFINGEIEVDSTEHSWTHFTIKLYPFDDLELRCKDELPIADRLHSNTPVSPLLIDSVQSDNLSQIVIVDDDDEILSFVTGIFKESYAVVPFTMAQEAIEYIKVNQVDLIITDMMMPAINGISFIKAIRLNKALIHIPIIILSAKNALEDRIEGINSGADAYISKPFSIEYIKSIVNRMLQKKVDWKDFFSSVGNNFVLENGEYINNEDKQFFEKFIKVIEDNISDSSLSLSDISDKMGVSSRMLYRRLEKTTTQKPNTIIKDFRLKLIENLLLTTNLTIEEIMFRSGIGSRATFFNNFSKKYGTTPQKFRQSAIDNYCKSE